MPANPLTPDQLSEASRLRDLFSDWQRARRGAKEPSSQESAAALLGFGQSALSQYLNGGIPLNVDAATRFATLIGRPIEDFSPTLAAQVSRYASASADAQKAPLTGHLTPVQVSGVQDVTPVKKVTLTLQAGVTGFETQQDFEDGGTIDVPRQFIEENDYVPQCLLAIRVKGESMEPLLYAGDVVVINIADTKWKDQGVYAINHNGQAVIKRMSLEGRDWWMTSENAQHKKVRCSPGETIIVGRVVWRAGSPRF